MSAAENTWDTSVEISNRDFVSIRAGVHAADQADVVNDAGRFGKQFGKLCSTLAVLGKLPFGPHQLFAGFVDKAESDLLRVICPVEFCQLWLRIGKVHMGWATMLKQ